MINVVVMKNKVKFTAVYCMNEMELAECLCLHTHNKVANSCHSVQGITEVYSKQYIV